MRRAGYTNPVVAPITWSDSTVVGSTHFNPYLRDNILAIDNRVTPITQDIVHYTPPNTTGIVSISNERVLIPASGSGIYLLALSEYSPGIALSVDASFSLDNVSASVIGVEAIVEFEDIEQTSNFTNVSYFKYRMYRTPEYYSSSPLKEPSIGATNFVSGAHLGNTNYSFWSGFVRNDMAGSNPFSLTKPAYMTRATLVISATNGSADVVDPFWALRFRANVAVTVQNPATNYDPAVGIYGGQAF